MLKKYSNRFITFLGGDGLNHNFMLTTAVHVLMVLGAGLSSVFVSVFLFKMNNSDYILTAKYNAYMFFFEIITFILCIFFYKITSIINTLRLGLLFYSLCYVVLLIFRNNLVDYYILVAFLSALGAGLYWSGHYILLKQHSETSTRQRAVGFLGISCYIVSMIVAPISGFLTKYLPDISGYICIFAITIISFLSAAYISRNIECKSTAGYKINLINSLKYVLSNKGTFLVFSSEFIRGFRDGITFYYVIILLYSVTSNEFIIGLSLMFKNFSSIFSYFYIKSIKTNTQRTISTALSIVLEITLLILIMCNLNTDMGSFIIFLYSFLYVLVSILSVNNSQIPLFDAMTLLVKHCKTDYEFVAVKQLFLNSGRTLGIVLILLLPTNPIYALLLIIFTSFLSLSATFLCGIGSKIISQEVIYE